MKRTIMYRYDSWTEGCGCCSNSSSTYDLYEDDVCVSFDNCCAYCENEAELREALAHLEPFDVDESGCRWF